MTTMLGRGRREEGASAVVAALLLVALGAMLALAINVGHLMMVRGQLQNGCDAAALAAAVELDGTPEGIDRARAAAVEYASRHDTDRDIEVRIDPYADVTFGTWDREAPKASAFTPVSETVPGAARLINAVRVKAGREEARGSALEVFFPVFLGDKQKTDIGAEAVAVGGAPCAYCAVPLVFAGCAVLNGDEIDCDHTLVLHNDTVDNIGFTNLTDGDPSVNTAGIIDSLNEDCKSVGAGDNIGVGNGNNLNPNVVKAFQRYLDRNNNQVVVPIVNPPGGCPAKFNGLQAVSSFATFTVTEVTGPPNQAIHLQVRCEQTAANPGPVGCSFFGTKAPEPALVR